MKGKLHAYSCDTKDRYLVHIYLIIISVGLSYLIQLTCNFLNKEIPWWLGVPGIFSIYGGLYYFFATILWENRLIRTIFFIRTPRFQGCYAGISRSSYDDFKLEKSINIEIFQTWDKILICLNAESSQSYSQSCSISHKDHPAPTLSYVYVNEPKPGSVKSMEIHYGMCMLSFKNGQLTGEFFTGRGRQTFGSIDVLKKETT